MSTPPDLVLQGGGGEYLRLHRSEICKPVEPDFVDVSAASACVRPATSRDIVGRWLYTWYMTSQMSNCRTLVAQRKTKSVQVNLEFRSDGFFFENGKSQGRWKMNADSIVSFSADSGYAKESWQLQVCADGSLLRYNAPGDDEIYRQKLLGPAGTISPYVHTVNINTDSEHRRHVYIRYTFGEYVWINSWVQSPGKLTRLGATPVTPEQKSAKKHDLQGRLKELKQLQESGVITDEEYRQEAKRLQDF